MVSPARSIGWMSFLAFAAFVSLGLPDGVLGVAWPAAHASLRIRVETLGLILPLGSMFTLLSSLAAATLAARLGVGSVLVISTILVCASLGCFAAASSLFWLLAGAVLMGCGSGAIDACINAWAVRRMGPSGISALHAFYGVGATCGPLIMTACIALASWRAGFAALAGALAAMGVAFVFSRRSWDAPEPSGCPTPTARAPMSEALRSGAVWLSAATFFVYAGVEVTAGQWMSTLLVEQRGRSLELSGLTVGVYWGGLTAGRALCAGLARSIQPGRLLRSATWTLPLAAGALWANGGVAADLAAAAALGLLAAPVYPLLMSLTPARVGQRLSAQAIGVQVSAATLGIAALPAATGLLARVWGLGAILPAVLACSALLLVLQEAAARRRPGA